MPAAYSGWQAKINSWLSQLEAAAHPHATLELPPLSPLKRAKRHQPDTLPLVRPEAARRKLVSLLCQSLLPKLLAANDISMGQYDKLFIALLEPVEWDETAVTAVVKEIAALSLTDLCAEQIASFQLGSEERRKRLGAFYTPPALANYIAARTFDGLDPTNLTVLDPACGGGIFLLAALNLKAAANPDCDPSQMLVGQLYGLDLDPVAVGLTRLTLLKRLHELGGKALSPALVYQIAAQICTGNALVGGVGPIEPELLAVRQLVRQQPNAVNFERYRSLSQHYEQQARQQIADLPDIFDYPDDGSRLAEMGATEWATTFPEILASGGWDIVIGNPPYVGFNDYSGIERAYYASVFPHLYHLRADLLYYFIGRGVELLKEGGRLGYVTSRFWKEAAFAARLRDWLSSSVSLRALEDRGNQQLFWQAEVDSCLLFLEKQPPAAARAFTFSYEGKHEQIPQHRLSAAPWAWLRREPTARDLLEKINNLSVPLGQLAECRTGVQTGLDRVFFVDAATARRLEPEVVRPALKCGDIVAPGSLSSQTDLWLIYPPSNSELSDFPKLAAYLEPHLSALQGRRRYRKTFPAHHLQWPRYPALFEVPAKLITPYKAPRNWFALDERQLFFSTDIVAVVFREPVPEIERFALAFLNSQLSTWQFRAYSKPVGSKQYDYYANPLKQLAFPRNPNLWLVEAGTTAERNQLIYEHYQLTQAEIALIEKT